VSGNGHRRTTKLVTASASMTTKVGEDRGLPGQPPEKTNVFETWCAALDILNTDGHHFSIRHTQHYSDRAEVTAIHLNRHELEALINKGQLVLAEAA
jgi:hypothetical protein